MDRVQASVLTVISLFLFLEESTFKWSCKKMFTLYSVSLSLFFSFLPSLFLLPLFLLSSAFSLFSFLPSLAVFFLTCGWGIRISPSEGIQDDTQPEISTGWHWAGPWTWQPDPRCVGALAALPHIPHTDFIYGHTHVGSVHENTLHMRIWCINMQTEARW